MDSQHGWTLPPSGRTILSAVIMMIFCLFSAVLAAEKIVNLALNHDRGTYHLKLEALLNASPEHVRYVITDYVHIYRLNPSIVESEILRTPDEQVVRVRTLVNDCIFIFCREILRVEDVRELETGDIFAVIVPELSNIKSGASTWRIQAAEEGTLLIYDMTIEPGFFVPPLIGTYLVKQKLSSEILAAFGNIERMARIRGTSAQSSRRRALPTAVDEGDNAD